MDCGKVGKLIFDLRGEKGLTQKQLADILNVSDKTISKWERGLGCPDISLLGELSGALGVNIEKILSGKLEPNDANGGNMNKIKFYACAACGTVLTATGEAEVSCCGRKLMPLVPQRMDTEHLVTVEESEDELYITFKHEMSKSHYLSFAAFVSHDKMVLAKLYPEQGGEVRLPKLNGGKLYFYCSRHGLWVSDKIVY